jgi:putative flippase GtrA
MKSWLEVSEVRRLLVFGVMGTLNTAICYALFATLVHAYAWHYNAALVVDYGFGVMLGFALHRQATFADRTHLRGALGKYTVTLGAAFLIDLATLNLLIATGMLGPLVARAIAVLLVTTFSYLLQKHWVFRSHETLLLAKPSMLGDRALSIDRRGAA